MMKTSEEKSAPARPKPQKRPKVDGDAAVREAIAAMPPPYDAMGQRLHAIVAANAPSLTPKTWYGMPAYAQDDKVVLFFRGGDKFNERYMTLGFNDRAKLDEGGMWPVSYAIAHLSPEDEERIADLVRKAVG